MNQNWVFDSEIWDMSAKRIMLLKTKVQPKDIKSQKRNKTIIKVYHTIWVNFDRGLVFKTNHTIFLFWSKLFYHTPGETESELSKSQLYFLGVLEAFSMVEKWKKNLLAWTLEIIQFIRYPIQMDRTKGSNFLGEKGWLFIVIQLCYSGLWPFSH